MMRSGRRRIPSKYGEEALQAEEEDQQEEHWECIDVDGQETPQPDVPQDGVRGGDDQPKTGEEVATEIRKREIRNPRNIQGQRDYLGYQ